MLYFAVHTDGRLYAQAETNHLVVAFGKSDIVWNPLHSTTAVEAQIYTAIYEGLVTYNPLTLDPVPGVARAWDISEDRTVYRFHLRSGARYWNGDKVTAGHFRDAWLKLIHPEENADYSFLLDVVLNAKQYRNGLIRDPQEIGIKALSDTELEVTLESPAGHFLKLLAHHSLAPIHPEFLARKDWTDTPSVISNGPFHIIQKSEDRIELEKNRLYWDAKKVETERLTIILSDDYTDLTKRFNQKEIHWTTHFQYDILENPEKTFVLNPQFATSYFFFHTGKKPWDDPAVRKALNLLVDWESVRNSELMYIPTSHIIPSITGYPQGKSIEKRDIPAAMTLLEEAGYPDGKGLPDPVILVLPSKEHVMFASAMKEAWDSSLGVDTELKQVQFRDYYARLEHDDYTLAVMSWIGDYPDPLTFLHMWVSDSNLNKGRYRNEEYDSIIAKAISAQGTERYNLLSEAESLILDESAIIPYKHEPALNAVHIDSLQYWMFNPLDIHPFKYMRYYLPGLIPNTVMNLPDAPLARIVPTTPLSLLQPGR